MFSLRQFKCKLVKIIKSLYYPNYSILAVGFYCSKMAGDGSKMMDATTMLSICDPVHMVLIKTDMFGETSLVASYFLEWRSVLVAENRITNIAVELLGVGKI